MDAAAADAAAAPAATAPATAPAAAAPAEGAVPTASPGHAVRIQALEVNLDGAQVLDGVDLTVTAGEWVNIIGPNGAGKTTMLRAVLGLVPFRGKIQINGIGERRRAARARHVAYVPQTPVIPPGMLVADYVLLGRTPHRSVFSAETASDRRIVAEVLERLDLGGFGERTVQSLSGGERQRAVLARALAQQTGVLLLDEPTTALDLGHQQDVLELVEALRCEHGLTVIATLHDLTLAARYGDRVAILSDGRIAQCGSPAEVLTVANISEHFNAKVRILDDPDGPVIVPSATNSTPNSTIEGVPTNGGTR